MRRILSSISVISSLLCGNASQAMNVYAWFSAAERGDVAKIKSMMNDKMDISIKDRRGNTALMKAIEKGHIGVVKMLLDSENEKNQPKVLELLHMWKNKDKVDNKTLEQYLISDSAIVNLQNRYGNTALMTAVGNGCTETVKLLLDNGADVNLRDKDRKPALMWAARGRCTEIVKLLLDNGADANLQDVDGYTALMNAAECRSLEIVNLLLDNGADVNLQDKAGKTTIMLAINHIIDTFYIIFDPTDLDGADILLGFERIVRLLLDKGADVNLQDKDGKTALMYAMDVIGVSDQYSYGENSSEIKIFERDIIQSLLDNGADVDLQDEDGKTALMWALDMTIFQNEDYDGNYCVLAGHGKAIHDIVQSLLASRASVNLQDRDGKTALMYAMDMIGFSDQYSDDDSFSEIRRLEYDTVQSLLDNGADVNLQDKYGKTALMYAMDMIGFSDQYSYGENSSEIKIFERDIIQSLLANGADVNLQDSYGQTALDRADDVEIRSLLEQSKLEGEISKLSVN